MLSWVGSRCWTRTKAMPSPDASAATSFRQASSPPADAPIAMTGISDATISGRGRSSERSERRGPVLAWRTGLEGISVDLRNIGSRPKANINITSAPGRYLYDARFVGGHWLRCRYFPKLHENGFHGLNFIVTRFAGLSGDPIPL